MDPITAAALAALAGSIAGEAGRQAWHGLTALVSLPFRRPTAHGLDEGSTGISSGELEVAALESNPADPLRAQALATALGVRAALDGEFRAQLEAWWRQAQTPSGGSVHNTINGKAENVVQGQHFSSSITFNMTRGTSAGTQTEGACGETRP
ncbi:hypothetical protein [Streptomyces sp. NPDC056401]|uniref:hypothetical protein n=1 Tax=Streptomyces sp. NPDC056401 TaxID=3345809 RepID=UPI0035DD70A3